MFTNCIILAAPYRRQKTTMRRSCSPDSVLSSMSPIGHCFSIIYISASSSKRFAHGNLSGRSTKRQNNGISSRISTRTVQGRRNILIINSLLLLFSFQVIPPVASSSDNEEDVDVDSSVSLNRLFKEIQDAQANIVDTRTENHGIAQQLSKLMKKMSHLNNLLLSVRSYKLLFKEKKHDSHILLSI